MMLAANRLASTPANNTRRNANPSQLKKHGRSWRRQIRDRQTALDRLALTLLPRRGDLLGLPRQDVHPHVATLRVVPLLQ